MSTEDAFADGAFSEGLRQASVPGDVDVEGALNSVKQVGRERRNRRHRRIASVGALSLVLIVGISYGIGSVAPRPVVVTNLASQLGVPVADNPTTTAAPTTAPVAAAQTTTTVPLPVALNGVGIGFAKFGDSADTVITGFTQRYGKPTQDTGWTNPVAPNNSCFASGTTLPVRYRQVTWNDFALYFGSNTTKASKTGDKFIGWAFGNSEGKPKLVTDKGIGIGSKHSDVVSAYGTGHEVKGDYQSDFTLDGLHIFMAGNYDTDAAKYTVRTMHAGFECTQGDD